MGVARPLRAIVLASLLLSGCAALSPEPDAGLPIANLVVDARPGQLEPTLPDALGPFIEVASGEVDRESFTLTTYRSADGACLWLSPMQYGGIACGPVEGDAPQAADPVGPIAQGGLANGAHAVSGFVAAEVSGVRVRTDDGRSAEAVVVPVEIDDRELAAFIVFLPEGTHATAVVGVNADGNVLDEVSVVSIAPGGPGAPPPPGN